MHVRLLVDMEALSWIEGMVEWLEINGLEIRPGFLW